ncbi:hypothetical protein Syun_029137 [Stephania yunnanensis]|uniref:Uncharacterized protein n=1 Tax=Stephania yunnanensis TaxID=152371 RepID=A0AAP0HFR7_9MAGN
MAIIEEAHRPPQGGVKRKLDQTSEDRDQFSSREIAERVDSLLKYIIDGDAVPALVMHHKAAPCLREEEDDDGLRLRPLEHEVGILAANCLSLCFIWVLLSSKVLGYLLSRASDLRLGQKFD